jgi:hypothetical protein
MVWAKGTQISGRKSSRRLRLVPSLSVPDLLMRDLMMSLIYIAPISSNLRGDILVCLARKRGVF